MANTHPATVDEYIAAQDAAFRLTLQELRAIIRTEAPDAGEPIAYQFPAYKLHYMLVSFGVIKTACSFYVQSPGLVKRMEDDLQRQKVSGVRCTSHRESPYPKT